MNKWFKMDEGYQDLQDLLKELKERKIREEVKALNDKLKVLNLEAEGEGEVENVVEVGEDVQDEP